MFTLDEVVPWGRSFDEYRGMFAMRGEDFHGRILGCADGPAGFNAEATRRGAVVISCDPIYRWDAEAVRARIDATYRQVIEQTRSNQDAFVWSTIPSIEELGRLRMAAMHEFLSDYEAGGAGGRYVAAELPRLPFRDQAFDLALSSHFLFLYSSHLGVSFHQEAIQELCRVAREVRIFPLLALDGRPSPFVDGVAAALGRTGSQVSIETVPYEFQRGANQMMRIRAAVMAER